VCVCDRWGRSQGTFRARSQDVKYVLSRVTSSTLLTAPYQQSRCHRAKHCRWQYLKVPRTGREWQASAVDRQGMPMSSFNRATSLLQPQRRQYSCRGPRSLHPEGRGAGCADLGPDHRRSIGGNTPEKASFELNSGRLRPPSIRSRFIVNTTRWERSFWMRPFYSLTRFFSIASQMASASSKDRNGEPVILIGPRP